MDGRETNSLTIALVERQIADIIVAVNLTTDRYDV